MKEIVVISGKGGTGKTSITASLAELAKEHAVVADCDVDVADLHLLLQPEIIEKFKFFSGYKAEIDAKKCNSCNKCFEICRFDAITPNNGKYQINELDCEGCGYCEKVCPEKAIKISDAFSGNYFISNSKTNTPMIHAELNIGADNSGKLVTKVKGIASKIGKAQNKHFIIVDGSPGIGCPVVSSISGADYVLLVTEPTVSGLSDLIRVYELVERFSIEAGCIINKFDLSIELTHRILEFLSNKNIEHLGNIPYDLKIPQALAFGKSILSSDSKEAVDVVKSCWNKLRIKFEEKK